MEKGNVTDISFDTNKKGFINFKLNGEEIEKYPLYVFLQQYAKQIGITDTKVGKEYYYNINGEYPKQFKQVYLIEYDSFMKKKRISFNKQEHKVCIKKNKNGLNIDGNCINKYVIYPLWVESKSKNLEIITPPIDPRLYKLYSLSSLRDENWKDFVPTEDIINNSTTSQYLKDWVLQSIKKEYTDPVPDEPENTDPVPDEPENTDPVPDKPENTDPDEGGGRRKSTMNRKTTKRRKNLRKTNKRIFTKRKSTTRRRK